MSSEHPLAVALDPLDEVTQGGALGLVGQLLLQHLGVPEDARHRGAELEAHGREELLGAAVVAAGAVGHVAARDQVAGHLALRVADRGDRHRQQPALAVGPQ